MNLQMFSFTPSLDPEAIAADLSLIVSPVIRPAPFLDHIRRLRSMFRAYVNGCPPPWPAPGLAVTPEDNYRSELWLPLAAIKPVFRGFYRSALRYPPIFSSCPLAGASCWAAVVAGFPPFCGFSTDPSCLLERLLADGDLRTKFLCWAFMPRRFYGRGSDRYPAQTEYLRGFLARRGETGGALRCLEAACGDGRGVYGLAALLLGQGWPSERFLLEGWSLEPLEVWAAAHIRFPHDPAREASFRNEAGPLFDRGVQESIRFRAADLEEGDIAALSGETPGFDLIICNGLLGGPIIHQPGGIGAVVRNLSALLNPDGLLLAADHFHAGWKRNVPPETLGGIFRGCGMRVVTAGEGIGGFRERR